MFRRQELLNVRASGQGQLFIALGWRSSFESVFEENHLRIARHDARAAGLKHVLVAE
jgi:hypothetical protein